MAVPHDVNHVKLAVKEDRGGVDVHTGNPSETHGDLLHGGIQDEFLTGGQRLLGSEGRVGTEGGWKGQWGRRACRQVRA